MEVEQRRLYLALGYSSMFVYCTRSLLLSEQAAYNRITAARAIRRFPAILPLLIDGALTLSSVGLLAPHLTEESAESLLEGARGKTTRDVERMIASIHAQPDIASSLRALPVPQAPTPDVDLSSDAPRKNPQKVPAIGPVQQAPPSGTRPVLAPISSRTYLLRVTISETAQSRLRRLQALLRHSVPTGDPAAIIERALTVLLDQTERQQIAAARTPRPGAASAAATGRTIPAAVRRAVWQRDNGHCSFVGVNGKCGEAGFLEFHHVVPVAAGGLATVENLQLRCRAHNQYEAVMYFGESACGRSKADQ